jgi:hypothetical protein
MQPQRIIVGPIDGTLQTNVLPFNVDNDSFPVLINAYQHRAKVKSKRGTSLLTRLNLFFDSANPIYGSIVTANGGNPFTINLFTDFGLSSGYSIVPGSVTLTNIDHAPNFIVQDTNANGILVNIQGSGSGTVNYATGQVTMSGSWNNDDSQASFLYYPQLPVMGLEELFLAPTQTEGTIGFDTRKSYNILRTFPYNNYNVTYYKNPPSSGTYVQKMSPDIAPTPFSWNGQNYQQFWTVNYQNAFWATNGVQVPFVASSISMQFDLPSLSTRTSSTTMDFTIVGNPLVVGDFVFVNEFIGSAGGDEDTLNFQTGYVTTAGDTFTVTFPNANITAGTYTSGMVQYLTNISDPTTDCIKWYDGDPTDGTLINPTFPPGKGWVNFCPPLSKNIYSIADLPPAQYYLAGARLIFPFKDRLLFFGPVVQSSSLAPVYLQDTVIWSQNGTPFYTASFTGDPSLANTDFNELLVPLNQTATPPAWWLDQTGFGGWKQLGLDKPLLTCTNNDDVLILGSPAGKVRCIYTGNDLNAFEFYFISTELNTSSTFSAVNLGIGVFERGDRGITLTTQRVSDRIDTPILDQNMEINLLDRGAERITAERDFINEWIYLTYKSNQNRWVYPTQTLQYNYRDNTWGIFNESYTTYGQFRRQTGFTWATVGTVYPTWGEWDNPWNAGASTLLAPEVIAGNQQGFVFFRDDGTDESPSLYIQSIAGGGVVTCPDHCLNENDYIVIEGTFGITGLNGNIFSVANPTQNTITLNPIPTTTGTYIGSGLIKRMYVPMIKTRQFPTAWAIGRKTRLGVQRYLFSKTARGQVQILIFLSQVNSNPFNIPPEKFGNNTPLVYTTTLQTCYESGSSLFNNTLMSINSGNNQSTQAQMWHRMNTSLKGDTVQIGITLSDAQMRDVTFSNQFAEIELHSFILEVYPSELLC